MTRFGTDVSALLDLVPAPMWIEDWSGVAAATAELRARGVSDLRELLERDRSLLRRLVSSVEVTALNAGAARLGDDGGPVVDLGPLPADLIDQGVGAALIDQILIVWAGGTSIECMVTGQASNGAPVDYQLDWRAVNTNGKADYSEVVVMTRHLKRHQAMQRHVVQLEALLDIGRTLASTFDSDAILRLLVDSAAALTGAEESLIFLFDFENETVAKTVSHMYPDAVAATVSYQELMEGMSGIVTRSREPILSADISTDPRNTGLAADRGAQYPGTSAAIAPIIVEDDVVGTLTTLNNRNAPTLTSLDLSLVTLLAAHAAVALRNADLYDVLRSSRRELELLVESKDRFIATVSHELRTPLSSVVGFSELIEDEMSPDDPLRQMVGEVVDQSTEMAAIIEDLLVAARANLDAVITAPRQLNLDDEALKVAQTVAHRLGKPIATKIEPTRAFADPIRVHQIVRNLLTNADRYGGDDVELRVREKGGMAVLEVCDSGLPLSADDRDRVFEPYETSGPLQGQPGAIGLGLAVSRKLAELMNGNLDYDVDGRWSVFRLCLPTEESTP